MSRTIRVCVDGATVGVGWAKSSCATAWSFLPGKACRASQRSSAGWSDHTRRLQEQRARTTLANANAFEALKGPWLRLQQPSEARSAPGAPAQRRDLKRRCRVRGG